MQYSWVLFQNENAVFDNPVYFVELGAFLISEGSIGVHDILPIYVCFFDFSDVCKESWIDKQEVLSAFLVSLGMQDVEGDVEVLESKK